MLQISNSTLGRLRTSTKGTVCNGLQRWIQGEILNWVQTHIKQSWTVGFLTPLSSFVSSQLSTWFLWKYRANLCLPGEWGGVLLIQDGWEMPAQLPACLLSSKHTHSLSQQAAVTAASRDFNELATFLQSTYLPPAAPHLPLPVSSLPAPILAAPRQRERGIIYCVPVENERLLHFNEH